MNTYADKYSLLTFKFEGIKTNLSCDEINADKFFYVYSFGGNEKDVNEEISP